jgi:hypothetical protein
MNVLIQTISGMGLVTVAWPFCRTVASLSVIAILYGYDKAQIIVRCRNS